MKSWTEEEDRLLADLTERVPRDWQMIAGEMGRSVGSCDRRWRRLRSNGFVDDIEEDEEEELTQKIVFDEKHAADWRERIGLAIDVKGVRDRDNPFQKIADAVIKTNKPIGVLMSSDWHLGSLGCDHALWKYHIECLLETDRMYMGVNGDLVNNAYIHRSLRAVWDQVMSPHEQALAASSLAGELATRKKLLCITLSEEHDLRDERDTGHGSFQEFLKDQGVPLFNNRGTLVLRVGGQIYILYFVHKSKFGSSLNQLYSGYREFSLSMPANVIVTSHRHTPAWGVYPWYPELRGIMEYLKLPVTLGGEVYLVQTGTYNTEDVYSNSNFSQGHRPKLQILIFRPDRFGIEMVDSFEAAKKIMEL